MIDAKSVQWDSPLDSALAAEGVTGKLADVARSIYQQESGGGKNTKTSNAGAVGGMQIIPSTFASVADKGWDIKDPVLNARAGVRYLQQLDQQSGGDPALTAAGYYGGPGGMEKARKGVAVSDPRNPNAPTTLEYGKQVVARLPQSALVRGLNAVTDAVIPSAEAAQKPGAIDVNAVKWDKPDNSANKNAPVSLDEKALQFGKNALGGVLRGAGSIGATIARPFESGAENDERRARLDTNAADLLGSDPNSLVYKGFKLGGEVAGTAGAGGVLANGARFFGAAPVVVNALASGGFNLGSKTLPVAENAILRAAAGGATGGTSAALVNPDEAKTGTILGGILPGGAKLAGAAGTAISSVLDQGANRLMQSAIKPTIAQLKTGDAKTAVDTLLQYGINPTKGGVNKLQELISGLNDNIANSIGNSTATVSKQKVLNVLEDVNKRFTNQVSPGADLKAIQGVADDFASHPSIAGDAIPVQMAQDMKKGTYNILAKKYGQVGTAETEAQKGLARGLKEEIATSVPGVQAMNAEESKLITTLNVAERRALMEMNKNPMGLAALAHSPASWAMFMADKSALFKSLAARAVKSVSSGPGAGMEMIGRSMENPLLRTTGQLAIERNP